jgi:hypothetical protein
MRPVLKQHYTKVAQLNHVSKHVSPKLIARHSGFQVNKVLNAVHNAPLITSNFVQHTSHEHSGRPNVPFLGNPQWKIGWPAQTLGKSTAVLSYCRDKKSRKCLNVDGLELVPYFVISRTNNHIHIVDFPIPLSICARMAKSKRRIPVYSL